ncbi:MAG: PQQ-dependent sugar dehydrogenase [Gemmatimonadales bacterium]
MKFAMSAITLCLACGNAIISPAPPPPPGTPALQLIDSFVSPVFATSPPADSQRLFVVEQAGRIRVLRNDTLLGSVFLDLRGRINAGGEEGLLSLAFHPQYGTNGRFYVYFTSSSGDLRIVRYNVSTTNPDSANEASADTVIAVGHPGESNHNGGQLQFGPDNKLYIGTGDGGGGGDVPNNAQNKHALLGKLLRVDVDVASGYAIPGDNPFATDTAYEPEIWSLGLRNPWRFSFDRLTGNLYVADVGQGAWEEVNVSSAGGPPDAGKGVNYGWRIMEGRHCFNPSTGCNQTGLQLPLVEYANGGGSCAVTGGYVYRGVRVSALFGHYLYADFCAGFVRGFRYQGGAAIDASDWTIHLSPGGNISSFGEDARGEMYVMTLGGGLFRIVEAP